MFSVFVVLSCVFIVGLLHTHKTTVLKCFSTSCKFNKCGKCSRAVISIYDNSAIGLCLDHSSPMYDRIEELIEAGKKIGKKDGVIEEITTLLNEKADNDKLIKDTGAWEQWMKDRMSGKK